MITLVYACNALKMPQSHDIALLQWCDCTNATKSIAAFMVALELENIGKS